MKTFIFSLILIFSCSAFCASSAVEKEANNILNMQVGFAGNSNDLEFKNTSPAAGPLNYETNSPGRFGVSLGYRNLGAGISTSLPTSDVNLKGDSKLQDYSLRLLGRNTFTFSYQSVKGFYVKNSAQPGTGAYLQKPDLTVEKFSAQWIYNFFHNDLSLPATFNYSGRQIQSGWTVLAFAQLNKANIDDNSSLVIPTEQVNYPQFSQYRKVDRNSASVGVGLAGALVYNNFQLAGLITAGGSSEEKTFTSTSNVETKDSAGSSAFNVFLNAGFNSKKHQTGITLVIANYTTKLGTETLGESTQDIRFFYGYRFDGVDLGNPINTVSSWFD